MNDFDDKPLFPNMGGGAPTAAALGHVPTPCSKCDKPSVTHLDGDWLCQTHADAWVRAEGHADFERKGEIR